jgi:Protein of unknown function (DUF2934)
MGKRSGNKNDVSRRAAPTPAGDPAENGGRTAIAGQPDSLEEEIRLRAYYRYLERETEEGDATTDWLEAESDILGRRATGVEAAQRARSDEEAGT